MKELTGFETNYEVTFRFYRADGSLSFVDYERFIFEVNAVSEANDWLGIAYLKPTNISVRGPDGRFVKWRH